MKMKYRKYPDLVNTMANRHLVYNETLAYIAEQERAGKLLGIRPEQALDIGKADKNPDRLKAVYELGRNAAMDRLDEIRAYLAQL